MTLLLAFLPFIAFAVASMAGHGELGLLAGALIALAMLIKDRLHGARRFKLLDLGTTLLFGALAALVWLADLQLSIAMVRLCVDSGLVVIVLLSVLLGRPFTLDYMPDGEAQAKRDNPSFMHTHRMISLAWAAAFAACAAADAALWRQLINPRHTTLIIIASLFLALRFTQRYAQRARAAATPTR